MARLSFHGAAGTVTGSRHLLELDDRRFLLDCGLFQGSKDLRRRNWEQFPVDPASIEQVFLSHAHIDHSGYLPRLCKHGFRGTVRCTDATADLSAIMLRDSAHLQEEDARYANKRGFSKHRPALPLYTAADAENALRLFQPVHYGEDIHLGDDLRIKFKDAGHILGSAFLDLKRRRGRTSRKLLFSGDFGRPGQVLLADPVQVYDVDYLVLEATYGDRLHPETDPVEELATAIDEQVKRGTGVLVMPTFSVGRAQTLLHVLNRLEARGRIPVLPVFLDSPMAVAATEVFSRRIRDLDLLARKQSMAGTNLFQPGRLTLSSTREQSKAINRVEGPALILSASGMATGGRILHHLAARLPSPENTVLFLGYQAAGTRGRTLQEGRPVVKIHGEEIPVRARIKTISGFSGHGDQGELLAWLLAFNRAPERTFVVHAEPAAATALAEKIHSTFGWEVTIPSLGEGFDLDL